MDAQGFYQQKRKRQTQTAVLVLGCIFIVLGILAIVLPVAIGGPEYDGDTETSPFVMIAVGSGIILIGVVANIWWFVARRRAKRGNISVA